jgi:WD40 repeat protein
MLWDTKTWEQQGNPIECGSMVCCVRYLPSGELAIATKDHIQIYNSGMRERVASFKAHISPNFSLTWTPNSTHLLTGGNEADPTIHEWDTTTWQQVGDPWTVHTSTINAITFNPAGTLITSASRDNHVRLWQLSD